MDINKIVKKEVDVNLIMEKSLAFLASDDEFSHLTGIDLYNIAEYAALVYKQAFEDGLTKAVLEGYDEHEETIRLMMSSFGISKSEAVSIIKKSKEEGKNYYSLDKDEEIDPFFKFMDGVIYMNKLSKGYEEVSRPVTNTILFEDRVDLSYKEAVKVANELGFDIVTVLPDMDKGTLLIQLAVNGDKVDVVNSTIDFYSYIDEYTEWEVKVELLK